MPEKEETPVEATKEKEEPEKKDEEETKENGTPENEEKKEKESPVEPPKEMRAVVLNNFGGLKSIKLLKKPEPTITDDEILVQVKACGLNFQDLMVRQGAIDSPPKTPFIMGSECAGEVVAVGSAVEGFTVGQLVVCLPDYRAWAELVAVPARLAFPLPPNMTCNDAAAITLNAVTADMLLFEVAGLQEGHTVLVHSAGGGLGLTIAQLARTVKDVTLIGVASKVKHEAIKDRFDHLLERGCDYVSEVRKLFPDGVDIVLDCLYGEDCNRGQSLLKPMGKYVLCGTSNVVTGETKSFFSVARSWWQVDKVPPMKLYDENKTISGFNLRHLLRQPGGIDRVKRAMTKVMGLWQQGKIKPIVHSSWALEDVADAMQVMHDRGNVGKLILDPAMEPRPRPPTPVKEKGKSKEESKKEKKNKGKDKEKEKEDKEKEKEKSAEPEGEKKEKEDDTKEKKEDDIKLADADDTPPEKGDS